MLLGSPGEFGVDDRLWLPIGNTANIEGTTKVGGIVIPDAQLLFSGDFKRTGLDLVLSHDDRQFLIRDYFKGESRATLLAPDGSSLSGQIVNSLTGNLDVAQAGANVSAAIIIGTVVKLTGNATAVRNGVVVTLNIGDKVHKGDVVQSGSDSALGISFIDGTAFSLGANARMVLNDMVYDPNGSSNSSLLSLVQGTISFVAGETAKNGNMKIDTPVATMGIRGTAVVVEMTANNGPVKFSVVAEPGGRSGSYVLLDKLSGLPIATVSQPGLITFVSATGVNQPLSIVEISKTPTDLLNERDVVKLAFSIAFPQFNFDDANPKTRFAFGTSGNNLADGNLLPHPFGGEYAAFKSATAGRLQGLLGGSDQLDWTLFINHDVPTSRAGTLVEDSVAPDQILVTSGTIVFLNLSPSAIKSTTFALAQSTMTASLPGFTNNVDQIGTFVVPNGGSAVITGINTTSTAVNWSFMLSGGNPVLQSLAMGQTLTQVYAVTVTMNDGTQLTQDVTVTMIGVNDTPTFQTSTNDTPTLIEDSVEQGQNLSTSGTIAFLDVDTTDSHAATYVLKSSTSTPHLPGYTDNISQIGSFVLTSGPAGVSEITTDTDNTATVGWSFTLSNNDPVLQSLAHGETLTQVYSVIITDNNGAQVTHDITVTLIGINDKPIITAQDLIGAVTEQVVPATLRDSGVITFGDVDLTDVHLVSATGTPIGSVLGTLTAVKNTDTTGTGIGGQLTWTYTVADSAVAYLAAGQTRVESFNITFSDQNGSVITKQIDITVTGTNDVPVIGGASTGAVTEDNGASGIVPGNLTIGGALSIADTDAGQSSFTAQTSAGSNGFGTFTLATNGTWTYIASNTQSAIQQLGAGQSLTDSFTAVSADGSASQLVTVTIRGTNDVPVIGGVLTSAVTEDNGADGIIAGNLSTDGTLIIADADAGQSSFVIQAGTAGSNGYGTFTLTGNGSWTYTANNNQAAIQQLAAGQSLTDSFTAVSSDGAKSQLVTVTIFGSNDVPVIGGVSIGAVAEDVALTAGGALTIADVDSGQSHFQAVAPTSLIGTYGTFTFDPNSGVWGYRLDNEKAQSLPTGQVAHDTLAVKSADGTASQLIDVTVTTTNDAPIVQDGVHSKIANVSAAGGQLVFSGGYFFGDPDFTVSDPDGPQFGIAITSVDNANGTWQYQLAGTSTWTTITLSSGQALLLSATDKLRFNGDAHLPVEFLSFRAWDGSDRSTHGTVITLPSDVGGSSAFSAGTYVIDTKNTITAPAGIAGEPINLGLADPSWGLDYTAIVIIGDIPSDWIVNDGVHNPDGSWTVQTTDIASLSVTTPASYSGAYLLSVTATVVSADGLIKTLVLGDNVEAYSPGSPIFAWSGDDYLTASSGDDLIVFAQPIGDDIIYSFDVAHDQIDLVGYAGFATFADVQAHLGENANGNATITLADGQSIVLDGIHAADLAKTNFLFDQTPTLHNAGTMTISDGAFMPLSGTINNMGTIALSSTGDETDLQLIQYGVTLEGGGTVLLSDSDNNIISGTSSGVTLNNGDNTISGAGSLGNGELSLANASTINATGTHALVIDTGSNVVLNSGTLEASGSGGLTVLSAVENSGLLWANGANLTIQGAVTGTGTATIDGSGVLDFEASSTASVLFGSGTGGTLKLGDAFHFNGTITGFDGEDVIDLEDIDSSAASISYQENTAGTGGTLTISDGAHVIELSLMGDYSADSFSLVPHQLQRTSITYVAHDLVV